MLIDNLTYAYKNGPGNSNQLININDATNNPSGYPGGGHTITYDINGNITTMPDKGINQSIAYNFLNLPTQIKQNSNTTNYIYRADGVKLKKIYNLVNQQGSKIINTEYLDGFQYSTPNIETIRKALEETDDATMSAITAGNDEAFLPLEDRLVAPGNPDEIASILSFFPTAEGYYDYENFRYFYQYKDHLGNVRVSFVKNSAGGLQVMDSNDYYPFGLSFMKPFGQTSVYDPMAIPYNYKYNGKELQETGMYDYGARMYMPDIGRWGVMDPVGELGRRFSPYNYAFDNPIMFIDPDGMWPWPTWGQIKSTYNNTKAQVQQKYQQAKSYTSQKYNEGKTYTTQKYNEGKTYTTQKYNSAKNTVTDAKNTLNNGVKEVAKSAQNWVKENKTELISTAQAMQQTGDVAVASGVVMAAVGVPIAGVGSAPGLAVAGAGSVTSNVGIAIEFTVNLVVGDLTPQAGANTISEQVIGKGVDAVVDAVVPGPTPNISAPATKAAQELNQAASEMMKQTTTTALKPEQL